MTVIASEARRSRAAWHSRVALDCRGAKRRLAMTRKRLDFKLRHYPFQPMLDSAKRSAALGAAFERPIMNDGTLQPFTGQAGTI